ncbi:hypothetical protein HOY80DRAFT_865934, partial [Tuber brumale]
LTPEKLQSYYNDINAPGNRIYGFIDGTYQAIRWPSIMDQKIFYSGYTKVYSVPFQAVMVPDELIIYLVG